MALSPAEKQSRYRNRQREKAEALELELERLRQQPQPDEQRDPLPASAEAKVKRAIAIELKKLQEQYHDAVRKGVTDRFDEIHGDRVKNLEEREAKVSTEIRRWQELNRNVTSILTIDEYKLIQGCLHPDRAPEDRRDRFNKAFVAMRKMEGYFEAHAKELKRRQDASDRMKAQHAAKKAAKPV